MSVEVSYDREEVARNLANGESGVDDIETWEFKVILNRGLEGSKTHLG
jgi:hypothetical protein